MKCICEKYPGSYGFDEKIKQGVFVVLPTPDHLDQYLAETGVPVDKCLVDEITDLWSKGINTVGCCCGHGKNCGYIRVSKEDVIKMKGLGYIMLAEKETFSYENSFYPKLSEEKNMGEFDEVIDNLRKAGGGIVASIVVKNGEFTRTIYQEATILNGYQILVLTQCNVEDSSVVIR